MGWWPRLVERILATLSVNVWVLVSQSGGMAGSNILLYRDEQSCAHFHTKGLDS